MNELPSLTMTAQEWVDQVGWRLEPDECADYLRFAYGRNDYCRRNGIPPTSRELDDRGLARMVERANRKRERYAT